MLSNCGAGEDFWESLYSKEIKPVNPEGNQTWIFIGWTDDEFEAPVIWPPDAKSRLLGKEHDGSDRGWDCWMTSLINWHEFEQTLGDSDGQGILHAEVQEVTKSQTQFSDWAINNYPLPNNVTETGKTHTHTNTHKDVPSSYIIQDNSSKNMCCQYNS